MEGSATPGKIRTPDQRLRVFVSSTLGELAAERLQARTAIEQLRLTPVMFELGARPHPPRALYRAYLEAARGTARESHRRDRLRELLDRFTEGFSAPPLVAARTAPDG